MLKNLIFSEVLKLGKNSAEFNLTRFKIELSIIFSKNVKESD